MGQENQEKSRATVPKQNCYISEILQFTCDEARVSKTKVETRCFPIPRLFRMCEGRPAVEITRFVDINMATGEMRVPSEEELAGKVRAKQWRDIGREPNMASPNSSAE